MVQDSLDEQKLNQSRRSFFLTPIHQSRRLDEFRRHFENRNANTMTKGWKRILVLRLAILLAIFSISLYAAYLLLTRFSEDRATEKRLLGKWELRLDSSDPSTEPPIRIIEWLPNGQSADYSPEMELWGRTIDKQDSRFNWYILNGTLISSMRTPQTNGASVTKFEMSWQDSNNVILTTTGNSEDSLNLRYRRVDK